MEAEESAETLNTEPTPEPTNIKAEGAGAPTLPPPSVQEIKGRGSKAAAQARPARPPKHPAIETYRAVTYAVGVAEYQAGRPAAAGASLAVV
jgi:hypothetical protein